MLSWRRLSCRKVYSSKGVLLKRVAQRPSLAKRDGLWVHQGVADPAAGWERVVEEVRGERIASVLKA